jgi:hypothetical protein
VEFLARALTIYAWYVAIVSVVLGVLLSVLYVAHRVRKSRQRQWFARRIPGRTARGKSDPLAGSFAAGKLKIPSDRRSDGA